MFRDWMDLVDLALEALCGLKSDDLPDQCYRDQFDSGTEPREMAQMVLESEGFPTDDSE
jgi:hypothetical protein